MQFKYVVLRGEDSNGDIHEVVFYFRVSFTIKTFCVSAVTRNSVAKKLLQRVLSPLVRMANPTATATVKVSAVLNPVVKLTLH